MIQPSPTTESISSFKQHIDESLRQLADSEMPIVLTQDGRPSFVVQEASAYERLLERAEHADILLAVREELEEISRGEGQDIDDADDELRRELCLPPRP